MNKGLVRCGWCEGDDLYEAYHDEEWGLPLYDDQALFEFLLLEGAQAGLSWITVLRKRENYRQAFDNFNPEKIARYTDKKITALLENEGIIRNKLKINSAVRNARAYLAIQEKSQFSEYVWQFVDGKPIQHRFETLKDVPATSEISDQMCKQMKKDGFNFVGSTICYAYMQATGMVNDHLSDCFRHSACQ